MDNCKVIAITNQKGGVGKTTTTVNLGVGLSMYHDKKVLLIDADPQSSLTASLLKGQNPDQLEMTLTTVMDATIEDRPIDEFSGILHHDEGVDLLPSNIELSGMETGLFNIMSREYVLRNYIDSVRKNYDYILIDCMPSLGMMTINALVAADSVIIPSQPSFLSTKGLNLLLHSINKIKRGINPSLKIDGILFTIELDRRYVIADGDCTADHMLKIPMTHLSSDLVGFTPLDNIRMKKQGGGMNYVHGGISLQECVVPVIEFKNMRTTSKKFVDVKKATLELISQSRKVNPNDIDTSKIKIEGMLQHYGVPTRFIDVVDNHWVALWMGLNQTDRPKQYNQYYHYTERSIPLVELAKGDPLPDDLLFQYILLIAVPFSNSRTFTGIQSSADYIEVDLRQALPSTFLRPHAQHGLVLRRKVHQPASCGTDAYDMAPAVIGIIKIRIDKVHEWMGNGKLLTQNNLFPPPAYDYGYDLLISRDDLFKDSEYSIARYV